jgi:hypothetical protein
LPWQRADGGVCGASPRGEKGAGRLSLQCQLLCISLFTSIRKMVRTVNQGSVNAERLAPPLSVTSTKPEDDSWQVRHVCLQRRHGGVDLVTRLVDTAVGFRAQIHHLSLRASTRDSWAVISLSADWRLRRARAR